MNPIFVDLVAKSGDSGKMDIWFLMKESTGVVLFVLIVLILFSISTMFIIGYKWFFLKKAKQESEQFLAIFWKERALDIAYKEAKGAINSPVANVFVQAYEELEKIKNSDSKKNSSDIDFIIRTLRKAISMQTNKLESMVSFLATIGSAAPFIGLFGTVWGIMNAFLNIGAKQSVSLATVAPGIAEALIATAIGLIAAIPAVIAYNHFSNKIKIQVSEMENFENDFLNIVKRYIIE